MSRFKFSLAHSSELKVSSTLQNVQDRLASLTPDDLSSLYSGLYREIGMARLSELLDSDESLQSHWH